MYITVLNLIAIRNHYTNRLKIISSVKNKTSNQRNRNESTFITKLFTQQTKIIHKLLRNLYFLFLILH